MRTSGREGRNQETERSAPSDQRQLRRDPLLVIVGPTAVGKTALSLHLAEALDGEIVSADSRSFYRGMDIGTDKPSPEDRALVRHHLIDICEPCGSYSTGRYVAAAEQAHAQTGLTVAALSGGVFQNRLLLRLAREALREAGFEVLTHQQVPANDGGLSLGQAVIGLHAGR